MPNPLMNESVYTGREAYNVALAELKRRHAEELATLVGDERESRGLPRTPQTARSPAAIRAKLDRALARAEKYRQLLGLP